MSTFEETYHRTYRALMKSYYLGFACGTVTGACAVIAAWLASNA